VGFAHSDSHRPLRGLLSQQAAPVAFGSNAICKEFKASSFALPLFPRGPGLFGLPLWMEMVLSLGTSFWPASLFTFLVSIFRGPGLVTFGLPLEQMIRVTFLSQHLLYTEF